MTLPEASANPPGNDDPFEDPILAQMRRWGVEPTREAYIELNWPELEPDEWTAEHEADLPEQFQDWSRFKS